MKVVDIMHSSVISVSEDTPVKEVARLIFSIGIAGVPVVKDKKLVGIVTEQDILSQMYPTMEELIEDYIHLRNFELMEKNLANLLDAPVAKIMNRKVVSIPADTQLMEAQSMMLLHKFSRLPIVNKEGELIGIISQGDIFRQLLKDEIPRLEKERYAGFVGRHYDNMVNWKTRLAYELPVLTKVFKEEKVKRILDVGVWTGEYTISLAKKGDYDILGLDHNQIMIEMSNKKRESLPPNVRRRIEFMLTDYQDLASKVDGKFDAAISMGSALPYVPLSPADLFKEVFSALRENKGIFVLQLLNLDKILKDKKRLASFNIQSAIEEPAKEHLSLEFFDSQKGDQLTYNVVLFDSDGKNWIFKGLTSVPIFYYTQESIEKALREAGFNKITFAGNMGEYQGDYGRLSFTEPFDPKESDWLNVVARR